LIALFFLKFFYPPNQDPDTGGLSTQFSPQSLPFRTQALTRWFATHQPERLKRKLGEQCLAVAKRRCTQISSQQQPDQ